MKVCLVSPPTITEFEGTPTIRGGRVRTLAAQPALGILSLAAVMQKVGLEPEILDLNQLFCDVKDGWSETPGGECFPRAVTELLRSSATVFGFSTICSTYPLTLRLAREVKRVRPDAAVVLGGPQASAVDVQTLAAFPFVDVIVRGEAEESLPALLNAFDGKKMLDGVAGITYRCRGIPVRTADAPLPDLASLPLAAYHLWPGVADLRTLPLEVGRGCPFGCTFCSTNRYFRRRYRLKEPTQIVGEMARLRQRYGVLSFNLVHDAFTVSRAKMIAFCRALLAAGDRVEWTCSARPDCVDDELLALMAESGCTDVFFGIETGSPQMQRAINKRLDVGQALEAIRAADRHSIKSTISLITGFPEENRDDLRATLRLLMDAVRIDRVEPQLHLVAPLAGSALYEQYRARLKWDGIFSDMTRQSWSHNPTDLEVTIVHPDVFPNFYALPGALERKYLMALREFMTYALARFRWLAIALEQHTGDVLKVFERWLDWVPAEPNAEYYAGTAFRRAFLEFVRAEYLDGAGPDNLAITALVEFECHRGELMDSGDAGVYPQRGPDRPCRAPSVWLLSIHGDYVTIIERLRNRRSLNDIARERVLLAQRETPAGNIEIMQLSPLAAALMRLCDGTRSASEIAEVFPSLEEGLEKYPPEPACRFALSELARKGLLTL